VNALNTERLKWQWTGSIVAKHTLSYTLLQQAVQYRPPQYTSAPASWLLWPFDLESGVRVTCDVGYLCVSCFSLPRPLCSRLSLDVRDRQTNVRQTDVRRASSLNASALWRWGIIKTTKQLSCCINTTRYIRTKKTSSLPGSAHSRTRWQKLQWLASEN